MSGLAVVFIATVTVVLWLLALPAFVGSVARERVERFAGRQALDVTADNGNLVINYLATTRRWRAGGMFAAAAIFAAWSVRRGGPTLNAFALFAGWFVGAVIAEWRVSIADSGARRAAMLVPRRRSDFVRRPARLLPIVAAVFCATVAVADAVGGIAGRHAVWVRLLSWVLATVAGLLVLYAVQARVLSRPQPVVAADVLAADAAIRARSLQVIAGCAVAAAGVPAAALIGTLKIAYPHLDVGEVNGFSSLAFLVALIVGWVLARAPVRRTGAHAAPSL
jgi:hypothetical protein